MPDFQDLAAMNAWLEDRCIEQWARLLHGTLPGTIADVWAAELPSLRRRPSGSERWRPMGNFRATMATPR